MGMKTSLFGLYGLAMLAASSEMNAYSAEYGMKKPKNRPKYKKDFESSLHTKTKEERLNLLLEDLKSIESKSGIIFSVDGFTIPATNLKNAYKIKRKLLGVHGFHPDLQYNEVFKEEETH